MKRRIDRRTYGTLINMKRRPREDPYQPTNLPGVFPVSLFSSLLLASPRFHSLLVSSPRSRYRPFSLDSFAIFLRVPCTRKNLGSIFSAILGHGRYLVGGEPVKAKRWFPHAFADSLRSCRSIFKSIDTRYPWNSCFSVSRRRS